MDKAQAQARIQKLRDEINHHRYLYHVLDKQEISDAALDSLKHELQQLEQTYPDLITPDSPTQRVGGQPIDKFEPIPHSTRMLSLQDVFTPEELRQWQERNQKIVPGQYEYFAQLKIDGVAVALTYDNGVLVTAATRGDGTTGENVTHNIKTIEAIPLRLPDGAPTHLEVRGEIYINKKDFERMNQERLSQGQEPFANPRNVSAGSIRQLDPRLAAARPLRFFAWEITDGLPLNTRAEEYDQLRRLGFPTPPDAIVYLSLEDVIHALDDIDKAHDDYPFQVDGLVIKINDLVLSQRLGVVGKAPRGSVAFKFAPEEATTVVQDISIQVGRTGALTPVAHLTPVLIAGTTVARATLHNADEIKRKDVRVGDTVIVRKAGDIIPEILQTLPNLRPDDTKPFKFPTNCPSCGKDVVRDPDGVVIRCVNPDCPAQQHQRIRYAISKAGFDIEGLGIKVVDQLLREQLIHDPADLWSLTEQDLQPLERFADTSAQKLVASIQSRKDIALWRFLVALGIPHVGTITAQDLARAYPDLESIKQAAADQLAQVEGIGTIVATSIADYFQKPTTKQLLQKYTDQGITITNNLKGGPLSGKTFLFTGTLPDMTRPEAKQLVLEQGGRVVSTVSPDLDYLVAGDSPGSKLKKAEALKIPILSPAEFQKLISP